MAARALSNDIQDHIERLGRMVNEDDLLLLIQWHTSLVLNKQEDLKMVWSNYLLVRSRQTSAQKDGIDGIPCRPQVKEQLLLTEMGDDMMNALDDALLDDFDGADVTGPQWLLGRAEKE